LCITTHKILFTADRHTDGPDRRLFLSRRCGFTMSYQRQDRQKHQTYLSECIKRTCLPQIITHSVLLLNRLPFPPRVKRHGCQITRALRQFLRDCCNVFFHMYRFVIPCDTHNVRVLNNRRVICKTLQQKPRNACKTMVLGLN